MADLALPIAVLSLIVSWISLFMSIRLLRSSNERHFDRLSSDVLENFSSQQVGQIDLLNRDAS